MKTWDVEHCTGYLKSNRMVESPVRNVKKILYKSYNSKALQDGTDQHAAFLEYKNTAQADGMSPVKKFL